MKRAILCALAALCLEGCATRAGGAADPIVGKWKGLGMAAMFEMEFKEDHSCALYDPGGDARDSLGGTWKNLNGKYAMTMIESGEEDKRTGRIDRRGRLVVTIDLAPGIELGFEKMGAPPVASGVPSGKPPTGEWRYAYTSKAGMPAAPAPPYDVMIFQDSGKVRLVDTARGKHREKPYTISGGTVEVAAGDPGIPKMDFRYRWEDGGKRLVLSIARQEHGPLDLEWTFLKPDQFRPPELEGTWLFENVGEGMKEDWEFAKEGIFYRIAKSSDGRVIEPIHKRLHDYYRLWKAPWGKAMMIATYDTSMGMSATQVFRYEKKAGELILTPLYINEEGKLELVEDETQTLKRGSAATLLEEGEKRVASPDEAAGEQKAREILRKCLAFQKEMKSFSHEMHMRIVVKTQDNTNTENQDDSYVAMESPNKFVLKLLDPKGARSDDPQAFCDGKSLILYRASTKEFAEEKAPPDVSEIAGRIGFNLLPGGIGDVPFGESVEDHLATIEDLQYVGSEVIEGIACHRIRYIQEGEVLLGIELWIEAGDRPLVHRARPHMIDPATDEEVKSVEVVLWQDNWTVNQPIAAEVFKFTPPAGAKRVKVFERSEF